MIGINTVATFLASAEARQALDAARDHPQAQFLPKCGVSSTDQRRPDTTATTIALMAAACGSAAACG